MAIEYKIGSSLGGMVALDSLTGFVTGEEPNATPVYYAEYIDLGNGNARGAGWLQCEWRFFQLSTKQVNALSVYCADPATNASIFIKTLKRGGGTSVYSGVVIWPQIEPAEDGGCYRDFVLRFRNLTEEAAT